VKIGPGRSPITKPTDEEWQITYNVLKELKKL
jgi:hypothetical protein